MEILKTSLINYKVMQKKLEQWLESLKDILTEYPEYTSICTVVKSLESRIKHYKSKQQK